MITVWIFEASVWVQLMQICRKTPETIAGANDDLVELRICDAVRGGSSRR